MIQNSNNKNSKLNNTISQANNFKVNLLVIDANQDTINKFNSYISQFNVNINLLHYKCSKNNPTEEIVSNLKNAKNSNNKIDYLFISNDSIEKLNIEDIISYLKTSHHQDCIIVFNNIPESFKYNLNKLKSLHNNNFLFSEDLTFDLFKKLIGYSLVDYLDKNKDVDTNKTNNLKAVFQDEFISTHDSLTMLPNRVFLLNKMDSILQTASFNKYQFGVFFIDLDGFKDINDAAGHQTGDYILQKIAKRLIKNTRVTDVVSRHGGDEFIVLLPHIRTKNDLEIVANKLLEILSEPIYYKQETWNISASIGAACYPDDGLTSEQLIANADTAMYMAKEQGKNTARYFNKQLNEKIVKKANIINEIRTAIKNNNFKILLQPQHELRSNKLIGAEVFIRWEHPTKGIIMPNDFLPYIDNTAYISTLGNLVLKKTLAINYQLNKNHINKNFKIAINVEARQLINDDFIEHLIQLKKLGININNIAIEITEKCFKTNFELVKHRLQKLRNLGIRIHLDDFGLGVSSITNIADLPIDILKIDNKELCNKNNNIIKAICALAHSFNIKTMAKRIDNNTQLKSLIEFNYDYGQGYCYAKPMEVDHFCQYVKNNTTA